MKLKVKARILSACLVLSVLVTACGSTAANTATEGVYVEKESAELVATPVDDTEPVEEVVVEPEYTEEEKEWLDKLMPNVNDSLNVRAEASQESDLVGRLAKGDRATVVEIGDEWTKITSGNVEGYVKNSYCIYGLDALAYAKKNCETIATTTGSSLRLRAEMSTDSRIIRSLEKGMELLVDTDAEANEEWVAIAYGKDTYYVSADYVSIEMQVGTGLTMEEIAEIERKEAEERAAAERARQEAAARLAQQRAEAEAILSSVDDYTLLAGIISCEAGGEPYETQLAVGAVVLNRVESSRHPNTIREVLLARGQFPPATNGTLTKKLTSGKISDTSYAAASAALSGQDNTYGCLYFNRWNGRRQCLVYGKMGFW